MPAITYPPVHPNASNKPVICGDEHHANISKRNPPSPPSTTTTNPPGPPFPSTTSLLRYLYADLTRISEVVSPSLLLHPADRALFTPPKPPLRGTSAVQAHENSLLAATEGTLVMDVESITANEHFGTVLGTLRASKTGRKDDLAVPFCGVWRFDDSGRAVEHWENAADPMAVAKWLGVREDDELDPCPSLEAELPTR
ncbi:hypothetical protein B0H63DRAFT_521947 [Podospora didyma]|uniref:SnoaL-like domain-containing protein n=1 Tax=Podospora didyma TaxID=330526 RepID=A0AAE0NUE6_9PEZI|nr:hypothetical protein B0H63DRAFT_521947 [Podospora didyma]